MIITRPIHFVSPGVLVFALVELLYIKLTLMNTSIENKLKTNIVEVIRGHWLSYCCCIL